jgi:hypothetical protein
MNIVDVIMNQFSGQTGRLASLLGESETTTKSALGAAVPTLLAALAGMTKSSEGSQRVASVLNQFDPSSVNVSQPSSLLTQGTNLVNSLLGGSGGGLTSVVSALSNFTGMASGTVKNLLSYVAPIVMGVIGSQFKGKPIDSESVSQFFSEQETNIASAIPAGLSIPGLPGVSEYASSAASHAENAYSDASPELKRAASWAVPVLVLALLAGLAYWIMNRKAPSVSVKPPAPATSPDLREGVPIPTSFAPAGETLSKTFLALKDTLATVKDKASAQAALPTLNTLAGRVEELKTSLDSMPESVRTGLKSITSENLSLVKDQAARALAIPGVEAVIGPVVKRIMNTLTSLG